MGFDRTRLPEPIAYYESQGLKLAGPRNAKWLTTSCSFHGGSDSMRMNRDSGGFCCMNCGASGGDVLSYHMQAHGLEFVDAARQLLAWVEDDRPAPRQTPPPLPPRAALQVLAFEATLAAIAAGNVAHGVNLSDKDRSRLMTAAGRINRIAEMFA